MTDVRAPASAPTGQPRGARDLMPAACAVRQRLVARIGEVFGTWGYLPVAPAALEYYDVVARGLPAADRRRCVRFVDADAGDLVTLRADATPQIARMIGQRIGGELPADGVFRYWYATEIVRQPATPREPAEVHQVGVELVGDGHPACDAELLALADAALKAVGLDDARLDLAHARLVEVALASVGIERAGSDVRGRLATKDRDGAFAAARAAGASVEHAETIASLCDAYGGTDAVADAAANLDALGDDVRACLDRMRATLRQLDALAPGSRRPALTVDLGEVRGFDYYSGIRLRGWAEGVERPVLRGGRYDALMRHYDADLPASGFAIDLDALQAALAARGRLPSTTALSPAHVVVAAAGDDDDTRARAATIAARARSTGARAWIEVADDLTRAQVAAGATEAVALTWVDGAGAQQFRLDADGRWQKVGT